MPADEIVLRTGIRDLAGWNWKNPTCDEPAGLAFLGTTARGTPVWIDKTVAEADLVVSIGCIEPHIIASFGGGYKNLVPGVAGRATIAHNHSLNCTRPRGVITDSHPMDQDLRQGVKALANPIRAVRPGGVLITLVRAEEGVGVFGLANRKLPLGRGALKALAPLLVGVVSKLKLKGMGEEDRFFLYFALQAMQRATLLMVAPTIPANVKENLPFVRFVESLDKALQVARECFPHQARVLIFPHGGTTYPEIKG